MALTDINAAGAWSKTTGSKSVVVSDHRTPASTIAIATWPPTSGRTRRKSAGNGLDDDGDGLIRRRSRLQLRLEHRLADGRQRPRHPCGRHQSAPWATTSLGTSGGQLVGLDHGAQVYEQFPLRLPVRRHPRRSTYTTMERSVYGVNVRRDQRELGRYDLLRPPCKRRFRRRRRGNPLRHRRQETTAPTTTRRPNTRRIIRAANTSSPSPHRQDRQPWRASAITAATRSMSRRQASRS